MDYPHHYDPLDRDNDLWHQIGDSAHASIHLLNPDLFLLGLIFPATIRKYLHGDLLGQILHPLGHPPGSTGGYKMIYRNQFVGVTSSQSKNSR